jgi:hypothetical protein
MLDFLVYMPKLCKVALSTDYNIVQIGKLDLLSFIVGL